MSKLMKVPNRKSKETYISCLTGIRIISLHKVFLCLLDQAVKRGMLQIDFFIYITKQFKNPEQVNIKTKQAINKLQSMTFKRTV